MSGTIWAASARNSRISTRSGTTTRPIRPSRATSNSPRGTGEIFDQLRDDGKPALIFASHLGNWEIPALAAVAHGLDAAVLYRRPNSAAADRAIHQTRAINMGNLIPASHDAPLKLAHALNAGKHVAMLVDQWFTNGVAGGLLRPQDQRQSDAGAAIAPGRLPDPRRSHHPPARSSLPHRSLTEEVKPVRDANGKIDVQGTMQAVIVRAWKAGSGNIPSSGCGCTGAGDNAQRPVFTFVQMPVDRALASPDRAR